MPLENKMLSVGKFVSYIDSNSIYDLESLAMSAFKEQLSLRVEVVGTHHIQC